MSDPSPALLRAFPELADRIPRHPFVPGPTPVRAFPVAGLPADRVLCKDDGRACPAYGGNKPRKLEWVIGAALAAGARRLVTTGGLGTHHGLATTILGRAAGLPTTLVLVDQPVTRHVVDTLRLQAAYGARQVRGRHVPGAVVVTAAELVRGWLAGERPALVPTGGSSPTGNLGFVSAGLEIAEQVAAGVLPEPAAVYVAVGTGGTAAGLAVGLRIAGLRARVVGVLVTDLLPPTPRRLLSAARATLRLLERHVDRPPSVRLGPADILLIEDQVGPGYGATTPEADAARAAAADAGFDLETTYTAKCLAALRARAARGALEDGPILFWNTFNAVDPWLAAPTPREEVRLPPAIRRHLERTAGAGSGPGHLGASGSRAP